MYGHTLMYVWTKVCISICLFICTFDVPHTKQQGRWGQFTFHLIICIILFAQLWTVTEASQSFIVPHLFDLQGVWTIYYTRLQLCAFYVFAPKKAVVQAVVDPSKKKKNICNNKWQCHVGTLFHNLSLSFLFCTEIIMEILVTFRNASNGESQLGIRC